MSIQSRTTSTLALLCTVLQTVTLFATPPNFVLIYIDDLGWTNTSVSMDSRQPNELQGFYETPNIEALAARGMRFSNAYAPASVCTPARKSIQIGKSPARIGR